MIQIERYLFRTAATASVSGLVVLTGVVWVTQALRQIDLITSKGQTILIFLMMTGLALPSLVAIIAMLKALGLPIEGIGLFIAVDRVLDMCRTTVNVFSDSCCAILVARTEGEKEILTTDTFEPL